MSTRRRGEPNTMNVLRVAPTQIEVERRAWSDVTQSFTSVWRETFRRTEASWF
jgi:hypothetical protein